MKQRSGSSRGGAQTSKNAGASVIPLRRVRASERKGGEEHEPSATDEGMAALARLLAEAWAF